MVESHCFQGLEIVYHYANGCYAWLISGQKSGIPYSEAISILCGKYKRFTFVHPVYILKELTQQGICFVILNLNSKLFMKRKKKISE